MKNFLTKLLVVLAAPAAAGSAHAATDPATAQQDVRSLAEAALDDPTQVEAALSAIAGAGSSDAARADQSAVDLRPSIEPMIQVI